MMKKIVLLAMAVVLSAQFSMADTTKKKDKKKQSEAATASDCCSDSGVAQSVELTTTIDSLSYAIGLAQTQGLKGYLVSTLKMDTTYIDDFIKGLNDAVNVDNDKKKAAYNTGIEIGQQISTQILPKINREAFGDNSTQAISSKNFMAGFIAGTTGKDQKMDMEQARTVAQTLMLQFQSATTMKYKAENAEWIAQNKEKEGVVTLPSGLQYKVLTMGTGEKPTAEQTVEVKYEGKTIDGNVFDSSYKRNPQTSKFRCDQVIKGWTEALQLMPVGSKWELYIPQELAYGERQAGNIKPFSTLIFTVELVGIEAEKETPAKAEKPIGNTATKKVSKKK